MNKTDKVPAHRACNPVGGTGRAKMIKLIAK